MIRNSPHPIRTILILLVILATGCTGQLLPDQRSPDSIQTEKFIIVTTVEGDTWTSLAQTHLNNPDKAWQIAALNPMDTLPPGRKILIPRIPLDLGGLHPDGYQTVPVLRYNAISAKPTHRNMVATPIFESQLDYLSANGFTPVSLGQFDLFIQLIQPLPPRAVVITFDTTDAWAYNIAFAALHKRAMKAAFFITPEQIGRKGRLTWAQLSQMAGNGMDIGLYGPEIKRSTKANAKAALEAFEVALDHAQKAFQKHLKQPCRYFAYPQKESDDLTIALLKKRGYQAAFTQKRGGNPFFTDTYKIKRTTVFGHFDIATFRQHLTFLRPADLK